MRGSNISGPNPAEKIVQAIVEETVVGAVLADGRTIATPIAWYPKLAKATHEQLLNVEIVGAGYGLRWPDLDEDLSVAGMLRGEAALATSRKRASDQPKPRRKSDAPSDSKLRASPVADAETGFAGTTPVGFATAEARGWVAAVVAQRRPAPGAPFPRREFEEFVQRYIQPELTARGVPFDHASNTAPLALYAATVEWAKATS